MKKPIFSIIVPMYNAEKYLDSCVRSVIAQSFQDFELILVDDGSRDSSKGRIDQYAQTDNRIKAFHKENSGPLLTRIYGLQKASGDYIVFLDSDDELKPDALEILSVTFLKYKVDCIIIGLEMFNDSGVVREITSSERIYVTDKRQLYLKCFVTQEYNSICRKVFRREIVSEYDYTQFYFMKHGEDLLQSLNILKNSNTTLFLPDCLYRYRINQTSITHTDEKHNIQIDYSLFKTVFDFLKKEEVLDCTDYQILNDRVVNSTVHDINKICRSQIPNSEKKEFFDTIRRDEFFQKHINHAKYSRKQLGIKKSIEFELFKNHFDWLIIILQNIRWKLKK